MPRRGIENPFVAMPLCDMAGRGFFVALKAPSDEGAVADWRLGEGNAVVITPSVRHHKVPDTSLVRGRL